MPDALYRPIELTFRTQFAELKDRALAAGALLPGTPGHLVRRSGTGYAYWYRGYYAVPGQAVEDLIGKEGDEAAVQAVREHIEFSDWMARQVRDLRKLGFQVADKGVARVVVELHNARLFEAGLTVVGTLAFMAWLNEFGARTVAARTQDVDLACRQRMKLAAPRPFLETVAATKLKFSPVPGMPSRAPSTSVKLPGAQGLRIDLLVDGPKVGVAVPIDELQWHAQTIPFYDWLLRDARDAVVLAGGHCIPVKLPAPERLVWHKLYASAARAAHPAKAQKDLLQAATLAAVFVEQDDGSLSAARPPRELRIVARKRSTALRTLLSQHPEVSARWSALLERD